MRLYDLLPNTHPEAPRGAARRNSSEAQFDDLECRDLLDASVAEYCFCRAVFNFGVSAPTKEASPPCTPVSGQQSGHPFIEASRTNFDFALRIRPGNPASVNRRYADAQGR